MSRNAIFIAIAGTVAAAMWAGAILLPEPAIRQLDPRALRGSVVEPAPEPAEAAPVAVAEAPAPAPPPPRPADPAVFGALPLDMAPARAPAPVTMLNSTGAMPLMSSALAPNTLQSLGATFSDSALAAALPQLGGAAALDGPADAGLEERVNEAAIPDPQVPPPTGKIIALDASEGTKLDPLRQRNWDLNAAHQVPAITPQR
jgi:UPF0755 protein